MKSERMVGWMAYWETQCLLPLTVDGADIRTTYSGHINGYTLLPLGSSRIYHKQADVLITTSQAWSQVRKSYYVSIILVNTTLHSYRLKCYKNKY